MLHGPWLPEITIRQGHIAYRDTHPTYFGDRVVFCGRCGAYHCTSPNWDVSRPWETPVELVKAN
jgi:hypothetical protein